MENNYILTSLNLSWKIPPMELKATANMKPNIDNEKDNSDATLKDANIVIVATSLTPIPLKDIGINVITWIIGIAIQ